MSSPFAILLDPMLNAEMTSAGKRYAVRRAAELLAEEPSRSAGEIVDLLSREADAAKSEFRRLKDAG